MHYRTFTGEVYPSPLFFTFLCVGRSTELLVQAIYVVHLLETTEYLIVHSGWPWYVGAPHKTGLCVSSLEPCCPLGVCPLLNGCVHECFIELSSRMPLVLGSVYESAPCDMPSTGCLWMLQPPSACTHMVITTNCSLHWQCVSNLLN